jgi:hypothetical protein
MEPEEPRNELTAELLGSWWALSIEALIESAGSEKALAAIRPHMTASARAGFLIMSRRMGWDLDRMDDICRNLALVHSLFGKDVDRALVRGDEECMIRFSSCPFSQGPRETCMALCYFLLLGTGDLLGDGFIVEMPRMMKNGDAVCIKWVRRRDTAPSSDPSEWRDVDYRLQELPPEERDWFFRAYIGEMWMITLRAFNDLYGREGTWHSLAPRMRAEGLSLGAHLAMERPDLEPKDAVLMVMRSLNQSASMKDYGGGLEVTECPFSGQPEVCSLLEAFLDGLCDALRPGFGFCTTQKMTDGATSCRSNVR